MEGEVFHIEKRIMQYNNGVKIAVMWPQAKEYRQPPEAGKDKKWISPYSLQRKKDPSKTWC